jgi:hypothetical protein
LGYKNPEVPVDKYTEQLEAIKAEITKFFREAELEEEKTRREIFNIIKECSAMLK